MKAFSIIFILHQITIVNLNRVLLNYKIFKKNKNNKNNNNNNNNKLFQAKI